MTSSTAPSLRQAFQPDGLMQAYSRGNDATSYTSLAAISFPVKP